MKNYQSFVLQVDYKLILKDLISFLSYINFGLSGSIASAPSVNHNDFTAYQRYNVKDDYNFSSVYFAADNVKAGKEKSYSIYGKVSVPVFIVTPELILHAGIMAGINYYTADLSYIYSLRNGVYSYPDLGGIQYVSLQNDQNIPRTESISRHKFIISPLVELNLNLFKNVLLKFTTSGYNFFSINAGVEF